MDSFWNAINAIGNFLIGIGTITIGIAAYFDSRKNDKK